MRSQICKFVFFRNTPLVDFQNTIHFKSNNERDNFFLNLNMYDTFLKDVDFNYVRDKSTLILPTDFENMKGINYCTFKNPDHDTRYYAYVTECEYLNDNACRITLVVDPVMTYTQGEILTEPKVNIERQHLTKNEYEEFLPLLRNNDDILKTYTKKYFYTSYHPYNNFYCVFQCACDLEKDFGTQQKPSLNTSSGIEYDKIISPLNLYLVEMQYFNGLMAQLSPYPWISQNIKKVLLIPTDLIDYSNTQPANPTSINFSNLRKFIYGKTSTRDSILNELTFSYDDYCNLYNIDSDQEPHLLRSEYTTCELNLWNGQQLNIDNGMLDNGLQVNYSIVSGYNNQVSFYVADYKSAPGDNSSGGVGKGSFLNDSLTLDNFDEIPVLIDNATLSLANKANQIELNNSRQISNRIDTVFNPNSNLEDRFYNAVSLTSSVRPSTLIGRFNEEYEYYRTQRAEFADLALSPPSVGSQTNGNSFQISNDIFGITLKLSKPTDVEFDKIRKYYSMFGYEINEEKRNIQSVESMSICNYLRFNGEWLLGGIDIGLMEQMKVLFQNGVRFWHNNNTPDPINTQNILDNKRVI